MPVPDSHSKHIVCYPSTHSLICSLFKSGVWSFLQYFLLWSKMMCSLFERIFNWTLYHELSLGDAPFLTTKQSETMYLKSHHFTKRRDVFLFWPMYYSGTKSDANRLKFGLYEEYISLYKENIQSQIIHCCCRLHTIQNWIIHCFSAFTFWQTDSLGFSK